MTQLIVDTLAEWKALAGHAEAGADTHLRQMFATDPERYGRLSRRHGSFLLDFSRQRLRPGTLDALISLAGAVGLRDWIDRLFAGDKVNATEQQAALHTVLRVPPRGTAMIDGVDLVPVVERERARMAAIVDRLHGGCWPGYSGRPITDIVNIGVGGSDLGPAMVCEALHDFRDERAAGLRLHFPSSMGDNQLERLLPVLDPRATLFIVSSKSFSTADTLVSARIAREWLLSHHDDQELLLRRHFIGVTANPARARAWGIVDENLLQFWQWVGGRYSLWSTIGLPVALTIGMVNFRALLSGAHDMDEHFRAAPFSDNLPVLLGLIGVWNSTFLGIRAQAVLPYDGRLAMLPAYLAQLAMESNGKSVDRAGRRVAYATCPILWGGVGQNAQHAFYQLLHQGTVSVTCDFIVPVRRVFAQANEPVRRELESQHRRALANCLAQSRLLAMGDGGEFSGQPEWRRYRGNQPSNTLLLDELSPYSLGGLIALYEHKVYVESVIWNINPFDQWGVELGKQVATGTLAALECGDGACEEDPTTQALIAEILRLGEWNRR